MASIGLCPSAFRRVNQSSSTSNSSNSFSIRSILNLQETENAEQPDQTLNDISACHPVLSYPPLVPRVVWPMASCYNAHSLYEGLEIQPQFGCTPQHTLWSSIANKEMPLKAGVNGFQKRRRPMRSPMRKKKQRPLFSPHQIQTMEKEFAKQRYVTEDKRAELALEVNLTETQVKTWFQNRRTKWKKESRDEASATTRRPSHEDIEHAAEKHGTSLHLTV